jgi:hypothetical protein
LQAKAEPGLGDGNGCSPEEATAGTVGDTGVFSAQPHARLWRARPHGALGSFFPDRRQPDPIVAVLAILARSSDQRARNDHEALLEILKDVHEELAILKQMLPGVAQEPDTKRQGISRVSSP